MKTYTITLVGAVGEHATYDERAIHHLLNSRLIDLIHGHTFTGKPTTQIYADANNILKIRSEIRLDAFSAQRWIAQMLAKEQRYRVHHPAKTWFLAAQPEISTVLIGNICPRLHPLHELPATSQAEIATYLDALGQVFEHYFRLASETGIRLDEGLSNFGLDTEKVVHYLDDDTYTWDRFISCAHMLGVYFRASSWLTAEVAAQLGHVVQRLILKYFQDAQHLIVLAEQLKDICFPSVTQQQAVESFIKALLYDDKPKVSAPQTTNFSQDRYLALLADVHANLPALETVLDFLKQHNIKQGIVLGDVVGYGPHPSECIQRLQDSGFLVIKGNHDHGLATDSFSKGFSSTAAWVLAWSQARVAAEQKQWLMQLPSVWRDEQWLALHGAPQDPTFFNAYVYEMTYIDNLNVLQRKQIQLCFHGHTHQPGVYGRKGVIDDHYQDEVISLDAFQQALICPGSVGQPRNRKIGAQFAVYDQKEHKIHYHNLPYPLEALLNMMEKHGFPETLMTLLKGHT